MTCKEVATMVVGGERVKAIRLTDYLDSSASTLSVLRAEARGRIRDGSLVFAAVEKRSGRAALWANVPQDQAHLFMPGREFQAGDPCLEFLSWAPRVPAAVAT